MFCPSCGEKIAQEGSFCHHCGNRIQDAISTINRSKNIIDAAASSVSPSVTPQIHQISSAVTNAALQQVGGIARTTVQSKMITTAVFIGVVAAGIVLYNMFFVVSPDSVVKKFVNAINGRDYNAAVSYLDPRYEKAYNAISNITGGVFGVGLKDVVDLLLLMPSSNSKDEIHYENFKIISEEVSDNGARIYTSQRGGFYGSDTDETEELFILQNFDEAGWRIIDIQEIKIN